MSFGARAILTREIEASFQGSHPAAVVLWLDRVEPALVAEAKNRPGVVFAEARRLVRARVEVAPGDWRTLLLFGIADFNNLRVSTFRPVSGAWPPQTGAALVEQSALPVVRVGIGGSLHIRVPGGSIADLPVSGIVHDPGMAPGWQDNAGYAYVSPVTLQQLGQGGDLDELRVTINGDRNEAARVAADLASWLAAKVRNVQRVEVPLREHPHAEHMQTMLMLITVFSALALLLSGALAANVMTALLAKQVRQIGVMKTLGATTGQVLRLYLTLIFLLSAVGVALGVPLGAVLARAFAGFAAQQLNLVIQNRSIPPSTFFLETLLGVIVPTLAAFVPLLRAVRMTAREAIQDTGMQVPIAGRAGRGRFARFFEDRRFALAFRNLFRRPARLWLTLTALAMGGAALITAVNVYESLLRAVDVSLDARGDNIDVRLLRPTDAQRLQARVAALPGVQRVEAWGAALPTIELANTAGTAVGTGRYALLAPPDNTRLLRVPVVEGRWPRVGETGAVVVNGNLQAQEPNMGLNRKMTLLLAGRNLPVRIVGVVEEVSPAALYTNPATMAALFGKPHTAGALRVVAAAGQEQKVATALEDVLADNGLFPTFLMTRDTLRRSMTDHFMILLMLLSSAALSAIVVGGLGLATSMSLNVLERVREIGVLRAIGATPGGVLRLLLAEGAALAACSVLLAIALSFPLSALVGAVVGKYGLHVMLPFLVSLPAMAGWFGIAAVVSVVACLIPSRGALRLPVREVLAHE